MKATHLAQTLLHMTAGKSGDDARDAVDQFVSYLKARRLVKLLPAVLREFEKLAHRARQQSALLVVPHKGGAKTVRDSLEGAVHAHEVVDHDIVGGYILETEHQYVDASYRGALLRLYRTLFK